MYKTLTGKVIGVINPNESRNVELIFSTLRLVTGKLTAAEKISPKFNKFKPSTFVELHLTELILFKISEWLSKLMPSVELTQVGELM